MTRAKCLVSIDGHLVMTSQQTGKRYVFSRRERELTIDDCDVAQFDAKTIRRSTCGCGGKGRRGVIRVFEILN